LARLKKKKEQRRGVLDVDGNNDIIETENRGNRTWEGGKRAPQTGVTIETAVGQGDWSERQRGGGIRREKRGRGSGRWGGRTGTKAAPPLSDPEQDFCGGVVEKERGRENVGVVGGKNKVGVRKEGTGKKATTKGQRQNSRAMGR